MCDNRQYTDATIAELHAIGDTPAIARKRGRQEALHTVLTRLQNEKERVQRQREKGLSGVCRAGLIRAIQIVHDVARAECDNPPEVTE